jgi:coenzyme F420-reducing hydrogenase delta subunit
MRFMNQRALKTYIFHCSNHLEADQLAGLCRGPEGDTVKTISLPCSGKVDVPYLIKAFESGADGVAIVTCKRNECRHFEGNLRACKRALAVESLLAEIGMAGSRMTVIECEEGGVGQVLGEIRQFIEMTRRLPQLPAGNGAVHEKESSIA